MLIFPPHQLKVNQSRFLLLVRSSTGDIFRTWWEQSLGIQAFCPVGYISFLNPSGLLNERGITDSAEIVLFVQTPKSFYPESGDDQIRIHFGLYL